MKKDTETHEQIQQPRHERVENISILDELKNSYLNYAMSVIVSRALPDVRDGLKPSQRRIMVAMNDLNLGPRSKHRKCAKSSAIPAATITPTATRRHTAH